MLSKFFSFSEVFVEVEVEMYGLYYNTKNMKICIINAHKPSNESFLNCPGRRMTTKIKTYLELSSEFNNIITDRNLS